ncbi:MAG TPA: hypothetical protein DCG85_04370 [Lachnospiraceae bacterium]|nr:hypothetical protein [Lachnospiraceae bacterium]
MDFISSKNLFYLSKNVLTLMNSNIMEHGTRTAYIFWKMLQQRGGLEKFEMAELSMLATLHDIGAYRTDDVDNMLFFEMKEYMPHSIYGYLFLKYLSPMEEQSRMLMYHHLDYSQIERLNFPFKEETAMLALAEKIDIYRKTLGDRFDASVIEKHVGGRYDKKACDHYRSAEEYYNISGKLSDGSYVMELDSLMKYLIFTNEEKRSYMEMMMYCIGLKYQQKVIDSVTTLCTCEELAERFYLDEKEAEKLYYAAVIHDIGMLAIPSDIVEAERKLSEDEMAKMRTHVDIAEGVLRDVLDEDIIMIASAHHERLDGSGYPKGLKEFEMTISQQILQVADMITGLINDRPYKPALKKEAVIAILQQEVSKHKLSKQIVETVIVKYDEIIKKVKTESEKILTLQNRLISQYEQVKVKFAG